MLTRYRRFRELAGPSGRRTANLVALVVVLGLALAMGMAAFASERAQGPRVSALAYPATLVQRLDVYADGGPAGTGWNQPAAVAVRSERRYVLDTGNNRILELDAAGSVRRVFDERRDERLALDGPMSIASGDRYLYVANSGASQVLVLEPAGRVVRTIDLERVEAGVNARPRPIGVAVGAGGEIIVSDGDNHRVLFYDGEGRLLRAVGAGGRGGGRDGFNTPAGLATDRLGNVYVVDMLNGRVVMLSPEGVFLRQFGRLGDTAGTLSRPKDVAVDSAGNVFVSDGLLASIQVFGPGGEYLGLIGREDPGRHDSRSLFRAPAGVTISEGRLYVMDRFAGLFVFQLPGGP